MSNHCSSPANKEPNESNMSIKAQSKYEAEFEYDLHMNDDCDQYVNQNYTVQRTLGRGGSCLVVECTKNSDGKKYAQKIMPKSQRRNEYLYNNETKILNLLSHPNIVVFHRAFEGAENFYILSELCLGGELFDRIVNTNIDTKAQAEELVHSMLLAIHHCHDHQIVHRDLKPENFVFQTNALDSKLVLIDFGCATIVKDDKVYKDYVGTPYYIAPESAVSTYVRTGKTLKSSDIWSIGILAFILMTGRPPFNGRSNPAILRSIVNKPLLLPEDIEWSESCKDFLKRILEKNPKKRMSLKAAMAHPWLNGKITTNIPIGVIKALREFNQQSKLKKAITKALAENMFKETEKHIRAQFDKMDKNKDGKLSSNEIAIILMDRGYKMHHAYKEARKIIMKGDEDKSGEIEFNEFTWIYQHHLLTTNDGYIRDVFDVLDLNGDGKIDANELGTMLEMTNGCDLTKLLKIIQEVDTNDDGFIDFQEFKEAMKQKGSSGELKMGLTLEKADIEKAQIEGKVDGFCDVKISG